MQTSMKLLLPPVIACGTALFGMMMIAADRQPAANVARGGEIVIRADNLEDARTLAEFFKERERQIKEMIPVGTVIAYVAVVDPNRPPEGWLVCDGETFNAEMYPELAALLPADEQGKHHVPDLRGVFLRGLDMGRGLDSDDSRVVGKFQDWSTAKPHIPFKTTENGEHSHDFKGVNIISGDWQSKGSDKPSGRDAYITRRTEASGKHAHEVIGGDKETCPVNVAVVYLVRCR